MKEEGRMLKEEGSRKKEKFKALARTEFQIDTFYIELRLALVIALGNE